LVCTSVIQCECCREACSDLPGAATTLRRCNGVGSCCACDPGGHAQQLPSILRNANHRKTLVTGNAFTHPPARMPVRYRVGLVGLLGTDQKEGSWNYANLNISWPLQKNCTSDAPPRGCTSLNLH